MPLAKQIVRIPILGGLAGKDAPLVIAPGSHLMLDNVRQERTGEWRRRRGWNQLAADSLPNTGGRAVVRAVELPQGGALALTEMSTDVNTCARLYSPSAATRWTIPPQFMPLYGGSQSYGSGPASLPVWSRHPVGYADLPVPFMTMAIGNGVQFVAWAADAAPTLATAVFKTLAEDEAQGLSFTFGSTNVTTTATRPRAVYFPGSPGVFALFWIEGTSIYGQTWTGNGAPLAGPTLLESGILSGSGLDAMIYPGSSSATLIYNDSATHLQAVEVSSGLGTSSAMSTTIGATQVLQLLPDPDGTGVRFAAVASSHLQQVVRFNSSGTVLSTTNIGTASVIVDSFAGCAVNNGAGAMLVYHTTAGGIWAWKMTTSSTPGTAVQIIPDGLGIYIDSNGWREPGTDSMHWIAGLHVGLPGSIITTQTDFQHSFYEMALEYGGVNTVTNQFAEPQARMVPLQAGPPAGCNNSGTVLAGAQCQVVRTGASAFSVPLIRLTRFDTGAVAHQLQYAIDRWDVLHLNGSNLAGVNLGPGVKTQAASYLPSGQLLQTVDGQLVCGHGGSAIPFQPILTATTGGALTPGATYSYVVVVEMWDEAGNYWRSTPSLPQSVTLTAGQSAVNYTLKTTPLEHAVRRRTVRLYRTAANGSTYFLTAKLSDTVKNTMILNGTDFNADGSLGTQLATALSEGDNGEQPATVTPAFSHVALFDGRLWGIDRDFPTRVWYSKPLQPGAAPEFPASFNFNSIDELGGFTALAACDDKLVLFKSPRGVFYVAAGGPANDGSGAQYSPIRVSSEVGSLLGQPYVSTGAEVYFVAEGGLYRLNRSLEIDFVGVPIDQYINQPLVNTPDTLIAATYSAGANEIRFLGTSAQYVFDRLHSIWIRDTFATPSNQPLVMLPIGGLDYLFRSDGTVWTETTSDAVVDDPAAVGPYYGYVRTAWIRPAEMGGYLRLYGVRALLDVVGESTGKQLEMDVFFDNSDNPIQSVLSASSVTRGMYETRTRGQKCGAFSLQLKLSSNNAGGNGDIGVRLDGWSAIVGIKPAPQKLTGAQRWS